MFCALVGLVSYGVAHTAHPDPRVAQAGAEPQQAALAFVTALGGTLCRAADAGDPDVPAGVPADCPLCHLASAFLLSPPAGFSRAADRLHLAQVIRPRVIRAATQRRDPANPGRAPPLA